MDIIAYCDSVTVSIQVKWDKKPHNKHQSSNPTPVYDHYFEVCSAIIISLN